MLQIGGSNRKIPTDHKARPGNVNLGEEEQLSSGVPTPGQAYGRSMGESFNHSWRMDGGSVGVWIPKPAVLGEQGFPARGEEIRREGWCARRLVRVRPPPPIFKSFARAIQDEMSRDNRRQPWSSEDMGGEKRRFEEQAPTGALQRRDNSIRTGM